MDFPFFEYVKGKKCFESVVFLKAKHLRLLFLFLVKISTPPDH